MQLTETTEACPHCWDESVMRRPGGGVVVHRDECAYCCRTDAPQYSGVYVCMGCFAGLCSGHVAKHMSLHPTHTMYTCVRELPEVKSDAAEEEEKDVYKLGVVKPKLYDTFLSCAACQLRFVEVPDLAVDSYSGIVSASVPGAVESVANEGDALFMKPQCPHLVCLEQEPSPFAAGKVPGSDDVCSVEGCGCALNNWMCVTCGAIGCPRAEAGGQGHALAHFQKTGHPASVKLGTITPNGADYYCYACDDDVADVHFRAHMAHFGIDVDTAKKTAKTMGEMQYDYSAQFDFNKITEAGSDLTPVYGPGRTGIRNIGNTCYIASIVQCLMSFPAFQGAFYQPGAECAHQKNCTKDPYACRLCQTERIAAGLLSGEFSKASEPQDGLVPRQFKNVYAQKHPEFSTGQQQDAQEYFLYLIEEMRRFAQPDVAQPPLSHPSDIFEMVVEQRVQCSACQRVRYSCDKESCLSLPIPIEPADIAAAAEATSGVDMTDEQRDELRPRRSLADCLNAFVQPNVIECRCEACGAATEYVSTVRPKTFPDVLPVYIRRTYFDAAALTTKKMDVYVDVPEELDLGGFRATGKVDGEVEIPRSVDDGPASSKGGKKEVEVDEIALVTVISMGIDADVAAYALRQTEMNVERAVDYIFSRPDIATEMAAAASGKADDATPQPQGQSAPSAATDGAATYRLTAMVSHIGASAKVGHYVCHIRDAHTGEWLLFNDEKVGISKQPPFSMATLYFYQRTAQQ